MLAEVFSDCFAQKKNYLTDLDTRAKMIFTTTTIILTIFSSTPYVPIIIAAVSLIFLLSAKTPFKIILLRLTAPLGIAITISIIQFFYYGETPIFKWEIFGFNLVGYEEGLRRGLLIMSKITGAVSAIMFLSLTTPVNKLLASARWFKVPRTWIEITLLTYRYIFVLLEDAITIRNAQKARLGYTGLVRSLHSMGQLAGAVVIRAYDQSISTYEAMMLRGYTTKSQNISYEEKFKTKDGIAAFVFSVIFVSLLIISILLHN